MKILLLLLTICSTAQAQVYATQPTDKLTVIWRNSCPDLPADAVFRSDMTLAEYEFLTYQWTCLNETQASQTPETLRQIKLAIKNTRYTKPITIYSVDPYCTKDYCNYGAKVRKGKLYYAGDPGGCPPARRTLERELRKLK